MMMMRRRRSPLNQQTQSPEAAEAAIITTPPLTKEKDERSKTQPNNANIDPRTASVETTFHIAKWMILRMLGMVYFIAFLGAYYQNRGLMGSNGLVPASQYMNYLIQENQDGSPLSGFFQHPTIFWWIPLTDDNMDRVALAGAVLSALVTIGIDSSFLMLALWLLDFSIVTIAEGTSFYSYGWESQLLETGFLAIFLCHLPFLSNAGNKQEGRQTRWWSVFFPLRSTSSFRSREDASPIILYLFRWLCFRISMGAGLIKIRGSSCWTEKTCLWYHFETQPIPSPLSFLFHFLPRYVLTRAVDLDLIVQLYTSWLILVLPIPVLSLQKTFRWLLRIGGFLQAGFMVNIAMSGNFAFLNHLTIIPTLACLDDQCWPALFRRVLVPKATQRQGRGQATVPPRRPSYHHTPRVLIDALLLLSIGYLSLPVIDNLLQRPGAARRQIMNGSFDNFRLVNTYGAFGDVGRQRFEAIIQISPNGTHWTELEFPCKPGSVQRRPCFCAPYHYRLDWNIWFLGFQPHQAYLQRREQWLFALVQRLLDSRQQDRPWLDLLDPESAKLLQSMYESSSSFPKYARVDMYHYEMAFPLWDVLARSRSATSLNNNDPKDGTAAAAAAVGWWWWNRTYEESLIPPVQLQRSRLVRADLN